MMASNRAPVRRPKGEGLPRRWWILALALFLVFDIVLVGLALNSNRTPSSSGVKTPTSTSTPTATSTPSTTPSAAAAPSVAVPQRLLAAVSADVAWRGTVGTCPGGPASLEYTSDGGATWKPSDPAPATGANTLVRVVPESSSEANVVTLNADCAPQLVGTFVAGDAWEDYSANLGSYWYVNPADRAAVHAPNGTVAAPCAAVVAIATRSTSDAAVLCADQKLHITTEAGAKWSGAVDIPGAVAIDGTEAGYVIAVSVQGECSGPSVTVLADGATSAPVGCFGDAAPAGQTAISAGDDGALWLWAGANFARSTDGGTTWD